MASSKEDLPEGDPAADGDAARLRLEALYRVEGPGLRRRLRARLGSSEEAGELVQDAFARLLGSGALQHLRQPEAFLNRIVRNLLIDRSRRRAALPPHLPLQDVAVPADQSDAIELEQLRTRYRRLVDALPPRTREVFLLHRAEGLTYAQIADRLAISPRTVEWHISEAIFRIGKGLEG
ncbi:MAG: polymerase ECF-type sigma factor [Alphaproteobacteria bacterium]|nr:polymerase ECF-type sigma factor [Alphaproteobacteria bacterium]